MKKNICNKIVLASAIALPVFISSGNILNVVKAAPVQTSISQTTVPFQIPDVMNLTAIPPRVEIVAKPGETIQKTLQIHNSSSTGQYIQVTTADFIVGEDGRTPVQINETTSNRYSLASWITVSPTRFLLQPSATQIVDLLVQVPSNALPGGHYAMVLYGIAQGSQASSQDLTQNKPKTSSGITGRVGTLVYVTVPGNIHEEAFIRGAKAPSLVENGPVTISFKVENRSDVHIRPNSSIEITDIFGRQIDTIKVEPENIFPYTMRDFSARFDHVWGLGRYEAKIIVPYGNQGKVVEALVFFWMIPYKLITTVLILILAVVAIVISIRRHLLYRKDVKSQEIELLKERIEELEKHKE